MTETRVEVDERLEKISRDIMAANLDDLHLLGSIQGDLEVIAGQVQEAQPLAGELARTLGAIVVGLILDEAGQGEPTLELIARGISLLQSLQSSFTRTGRETVKDPLLWDQLRGLIPGEGDADSSRTAEEPGEQTITQVAPEPAAPPLAADAGRPVEIDASLFGDLEAEAEEHLNTAESGLLALETNPEDGERLNEIFRAFHTIKGAAGFLNLVEVTHVAHAVEDVLDAARKGRLRISSPILDVALEAVDLLKALLKDVRTRLDGEAAPPRDVAGFLSRVELATRADGGAASPPNGSGAAVAVGEVQPAAGSSAGAPANGGTPAEPRHQDQNFVRVGTAKLDQLVNMVGELVIAQTQVSQNPEIVGMESERLTRDLAQLNRITRDIQEVAMSMRMVPIHPTFERMARMVRDLARKLGKQVDFQMVGEDTELDKNMVEEIVDPLIHMVRNAVDHGIESPAERRAAGKPEKGTVVLAASHQGGSILIELRDDGKGLDQEKILRTAIERGLAQPGESFSPEQIYDFLFRPGFSLARQVSDISGRGVGMDVVRRSIEKLRGTVEVQSQVGKGSTFAIRLPLTLAIIDGMVVGVGGERYILPLTSIVRSLRPTPEQVLTVMGRGEMVQVQDDLFPLLRLHERFAVGRAGTHPWDGLVVVVEAASGRCCLLVDELVGIQQVVIKGLEDELRREKAVAGCTILGDGRVGLILDASGLVQPAHGNGNGQPALESVVDLGPPTATIAAN